MGQNKSPHDQTVPSKKAHLGLTSFGRRSEETGETTDQVTMGASNHQQGDFYHFVAELRLDSQRRHQYFRMSAEQMDHLLSYIGPEIYRQSTNYRAAIDPNQRLAVALRFLASGDSLLSLSFAYRLGLATVQNSVHMVFAAIAKIMLPEFLPKPTEDTWREISLDFWERWNFPNCLGAIDGKHVTIHATPRSGSLFFNYKKTFSVILMALVDAQYRFRVIQVGDYGRTSDGGIYARSALGRGMEQQTLQVPSDAPLPGAARLGNVPFVIVGDAAFPLKTYLMRPYAQQNLTKEKRIFNYRLSRARMVVESAFGILASRWRIFYRRINLHPDKVDNVVVAAAFSTIISSLHVTIREQPRRMQGVRNMAGNRASQDALDLRDVFCQYFNSPEGSVAWQERMY
uniref:DDE Tnp4 domain-containing protein n=1 Tax=Neogobius melanostomus TaxID=47308 RepID=A0A8C6SIV0_9GOBI